MDEHSSQTTSPKQQMPDDCAVVDDPLADCIVYLGKLYNVPVSKTGLRAGLPLVEDRLTVELLPRAAERAGFSARLLKRPLQKMSDFELPCVLLLSNGRACILTSIDQVQQTAKVILPESGFAISLIALQELADRYNGYAFFIRKKYREDKELRFMPAQSVKHWFWSPLFSSWRILRDVLLASFFINLFGLTGPFFTMNVYDRVIPNLAFDTLWVLAIGIGVIYGFNLVMKGLRSYFIDEAGKKFNLRISSVLLEKVLDLRMEVRPKSVGAFTRNLQEFDAVREFITSFSITALIDLPFMVLGLLAVWYLGGPIVLVHLAALCLMALYAYIIQAPLKGAVEKSFQAGAQKNSILVEGLSGIETIKMLGAEGQFQRAWEEAVSHIAIWGNRSRLYSSSVGYVTDFILNLTTVAVLIAGVYRLSAGNLTQGGIIALVILSRQAIAPMSQVVNLAARYHRAKTALGALNTIMALPVERPADQSFLHRSQCRGRLSLVNVDFQYPQQSGKALHNINIDIAPAEKVALIGPIGSGKTTLGKLLLGLYQPTQGMVCLDNTDIRQIDPAELRRFIGYVPQDVVLFRGTIRDNIIFGSPEVDAERILWAAETAGVMSFVGKHAKGFDMEIGEQGRGLSGGQRQSVAIARALLHDPPILVFDEPSSAMDNRTEAQLKTSLAKILPSKTLILITHRGSLLSLVQRIVLIDNGIVVADGPRDQVMTAMKTGQINI